MDTLITWLFGFLSGALTGAAGKYLADKYTDRRRQKEAVASLRSESSRIHRLMPDLIEEMKTDLAGDDSGVIREFAILPNDRLDYVHPRRRFVYYEDRIPNLENKIATLLDLSLVTEIPSEHARTFRLRESFVALLRES